MNYMGIDHHKQYSHIPSPQFRSEVTAGELGVGEGIRHEK